MAEQNLNEKLKKGKSIQSRLNLLLLLILIPVLAIQSYIYYENYQASRAAELQANLEMAHAVAKGFDSFIKDIIHQELALGRIITSTKHMTGKDINGLLEETSQNYSTVRDFTWLNAQGVAIHSSNPDLIGRHLNDRSYFRDIVNGREWTVGELVLSKSTKKPVFGVSCGIRDKKGILLGIVLGVVIPEKLDVRLGVEKSEGRAFALVDNKGALVFRHPAGDQTWEERKNWLKLFPEFGDALHGKEVTATVFIPNEKKKRLAAFTPVSSIGWAASTAKGEDEVTGPILSSIGKSALLFLSVLIISFIAALIFSRKIADPVKELRTHAFALGEGNVSSQVKISNVLEFQDLAEAFNAMTEKVQARERDLRASEQRWATTLSSIGDAVIATDVEGRVTFMNAVAESLTGFTLHEAAMKPVKTIFNIIDDKTRKEIENPVGKVLREINVVSLANHATLIKKNGEEIPIDDSGAPIIDKEGKTIGVVLVFRDISERKLTEEALRDSEERMRYALESSHTGAWSLNLRDYSLSRSQEYDQIIGYSASLPNWTYKTFLDYILTEDRAAVDAKFQQSLQDGSDWSFECRIRHADGEIRWIWAAGRHQRGTDGRPLYLTGIVQDITERKEAEQELRKSEELLRIANQELESFAYSVSHDLRVPLRAIDGFTRILLKKSAEKLDNDEKRKLEVIRRSVQKMGELIDDLLAFSRLNRRKLSKVDLDMEALVKEVWEDLIAINPGREMSLIIKPMLPAAFGDRPLIRQVYNNLLENAVKFTRDRNPAIIETGCLDSNEGILYYVKDNGIGFDIIFHDKIFGVFQRLHTPEEYEGNGIGLAVVQRIIQHHGGRVWAESKVNEGAAFYFTLPV